MFEAFVPKITLSGNETRKGDGIGMRCGGQTMLFDGFEGGEPTNNLMSWLAGEGVEVIDTVVLSHIHYDHYNGLLQIGQKYKIKLLYMYDPLTLKHGCDGSANGRAVKEDMDNAYKFVRKMQSYGTRVLWLDKGATIKCGDVSFRVWRKQPTEFQEDEVNGWAFVNDGSLVLWSPETQLLLGGDGPTKIKEAIAFFGAKVSGYDISHHGNNCSQSNAEALKAAGCVVAWESNIERNGAGTTGFTMYGARRVVQQGIPVWMQDAPIYITAAEGKIVFRQGSKTISKTVPYSGKGSTDMTGEWKQGSKGWWYQYADGSYATGWALLPWSGGTSWFYFDSDGWMLTGWRKLKWSGGESWFFFDYKTCAMKVGWQKLPWGDGKENWFLLDPKTGAMLMGWQWSTKDGKTGWYYLDPKTGAMKTGWLYDDGEWFCLGDDGRMLTGWVTYKGRKCYLEPLSDKNHVQGVCYRNRTATIDGKTYTFDNDGYATEVKASGNITKVSGKLNDISASRREFVIDIANYVRKYAPQYGIKVYSPIIAQAIHESGWGESKLAAKYHNYFGLKCGTKWTGKSVNMKTQEEYSAGSLTTISANFRVYDSMEEGVKGYFEFIQLPRYSNLKGITSPRKYLETIIADGYATGKSYVDHTMNIINLYNLTQFDGVVAPATPSTPSKPTTNANPVDVLMSIASAEVGYHEGANNKNKYGDELHKIQPRNMDASAPWCDAFADWTVLKMCEAFGYGADMAREVLCGDFDDYTYASINLYKRQGRWAISPARGYQIFFGGSGHTGWVESVDSKIHTIEGNKSDQVMRCTYALNDSRIIGYGMPRYELLSGGLTAENMPLIKKGATGWAVRELQKRLNAASYNGKIVLTVDGDFGNNTYNALRAYQKDRGLEVDGECGKNSWQSLFNEV